MYTWLYIIANLNTPSGWVEGNSLGEFSGKAASLGLWNRGMDQEPAVTTKPSDLPPSVAEAFDILRPRMELDGRKFILIAFEREAFMRSATDGGPNYVISTAASCGRQVVLQVIKDYLRQEEQRDKISERTTNQMTIYGK